MVFDITQGGEGFVHLPFIFNIDRYHILWSRQGKGLYSSRNPAFADRFATSCLSSPYRVMIACDVALPQQLDKSTSVTISDLNVGQLFTIYVQVVAGDRVVVRKPEAIVPRFIVMYVKQS